MTSSGSEAADVALTASLAWALVGEALVAVPLLILIAVTVNRNFDRWLIIKSRGIWYIRCLTYGPFVQLVLSMTVAFTCWQLQWSQTAPALAALTIAEETCLAFMTGVMVARQLVLAIVFRTLPGQRASTVHAMNVTPAFFLIVPILVAAFWILLGEIPQQLAIFGVMSLTVSSIMTYLVAAVIVLLYAVPAFANREIPMEIFCDYWPNVVTFSVLVIATVTVSCINSLVLVPAGYLLAYRAARSVAYVAVVSLYSVINLIRPAWAIWTRDVAYLNHHEEAIRGVKITVPVHRSGAPPPPVEHIVMERITVHLEAADPTPGMPVGIPLPVTSSLASAPPQPFASAPASLRKQSSWLGLRADSSGSSSASAIEATTV